MDQHDNSVVLDRYIDSYAESKVSSLNRRDDIIGEESFRLCEVVINADSGILGAIGLSVLISQNIQPLVAVLLAGNVLFIIFVIYRSFSLRKEILALRRTVVEKKSHTDNLVRDALLERYEELLHISYDEFKKRFVEIKNEQKEQKPTSEEINEQTAANIKSVNRLRMYFISTLVITVVAVIIQLFQTVFA